eukprot:3201133-Prymnesium_polylepis.1
MLRPSLARLHATVKFGGRGVVRAPATTRFSAAQKSSWQISWHVPTSLSRDHSGRWPMLSPEA